MKKWNTVVAVGGFVGYEQCREILCAAGLPGHDDSFFLRVIDEGVRLDRLIRKWPTVGVPMVSSQPAPTRANGTDETNTGPVQLRGPGETVTVLGKDKPALTDAQYSAVKALLKAGEDGLTKDVLEIEAGAGARRTLTQLRNGDPDWDKIIHFPGAAGCGGYRIIDPHKSS